MNNGRVAVIKSNVNAEAAARRELWRCLSFRIQKYATALFSIYASAIIVYGSRSNIGRADQTFQLARADNLKMTTAVSCASPCASERTNERASKRASGRAGWQGFSRRVFRDETRNRDAEVIEILKGAESCSRKKIAGRAFSFVVVVVAVAPSLNLNTRATQLVHPQFRTPFCCFGYSSSAEKPAGTWERTGGEKMPRRKFSYLVVVVVARIEKFCFHGKYMDKVSSNWLSR